MRVLCAVWCATVLTCDVYLSPRDVNLVSVADVRTRLPPPVDIFDVAALHSYVLAQYTAAARGVPLKPAHRRGTYDDSERLTSWKLGATRDREVAKAMALKYIREGNEIANRCGYAATWGAPGSGKVSVFKPMFII